MLVHCYGQLLKKSEEFGVKKTLVLIAVLTVCMFSTVASRSLEPIIRLPGISAPLSVNLPALNLTLIASNGTQLRLNQVSIGNLPSFSGYGGFKNVLGNIKMWGYYSGVSLAVLCNLIGGMAANDSLTVTAADNYTITLTYAQFDGNFVAYNNVTGQQVPNNQSLTPIVAYQYDGANLTSDDGGPLRLAIVGPEGLVTDSSYWVKWVTKIEIMPAPPSVTPLEGIIGTTGYKLILTEAINNSLGSMANIDYYWNFHTDKWNGIQWAATSINGSSSVVIDYAIPANTTVDLPYYVYLLPISGSNAVVWGEWLRISYTFHWVYNSMNYSTSYMAKLNVHPGDIGGASVVFPYPGADGVVNARDLSVLSSAWLQSVTAGTSPTANVFRSDLNGDGVVNARDLSLFAGNWLLGWSNSPPG